MTRVYARKFDWDEARMRYAAGESISRIAAALGVTWSAVQRVVVPGKAEAMAAYQKQLASRGRCDECGGPMNQLSRYRGSTRCWDCATLARATNVQPDRLRCFRCHEWKADDAFPFNRGGKPTHRGRHHVCRACQTVVKREYRQRNREKANAYQRAYKARKRAEARAA